jgi:hypothetical protein
MDIKRLYMLYGEDYKINEDISIKNPQLREIMDLGYETYFSYVNSLILTPYEIGDILWFDMGVWYEDVTQWEMFLSFFEKDEVAQKALAWFLKVDDLALIQNTKTEEYYFVFIKDEKQIFVTEENFYEISSMIRKINNVPPPYEVGKETTKFVKIRLLERMKHDREKPKKNNFKENINIESIISSVAWCGTSNIIDIWNLTIYQLYDGYSRLSTKDNYDKTMSAIYAGTIESDKINQEQIYWAKVFNQE